MFWETDNAIRTRIQALSFAPYNPVITGFMPEEHVKPKEPVRVGRQGEHGLPSIALDSIAMMQDLARSRKGEDLVLGYEGGNAFLVDYPDPWMITYQIDIRSSSNRKTARLETNLILQKFLAWCPGFIMDVAWALGDWEAAGKVECRLTESPQFLGKEGDGRLRYTLRFDAATWLFQEVTPRIVGRIAYRIFEMADGPDFTVIYKTEDPEGFYS